MARGHQKIQPQQKAQEKQAKMKKQQGHSAGAAKAAAQAGLKAACTVCKVRTMDYFYIQGWPARNFIFKKYVFSKCLLLINLKLLLPSKICLNYNILNV